MRLVSWNPVGRTLVACAAAFLGLGSLGCGGGKGSVTGSVTLDGEPLSAGTVSFIPAQGPAVAGVIRDGKYTVKDVPTGEVKVVVQTPGLKAQAAEGSAGAIEPGSYSMPPGAKLDNLPPEAVAEIERRKQAAAGQSKSANSKPVPDKYGDPATSGLTTTVKGGQNTYDIPLTSK